MKKINEPIKYYISKFDSPIIIESPNRFKMTLALMLELKSNYWKLTDKGHFETEDGKKVTYQMIKEIIDIPPYTISKILKDIKESRTVGYTGGVTAKEKKHCKLNRLVKIAFEMVNDCFLREIDSHYWEDDFEQEMKRHGVDIEDEEQMDLYCLKNKNKLKKRYDIIELPDWYKNSFPECSRQTMNRDFSVLNDVGCLIEYIPETKEYEVQNPWQF